MLLMSQHKLGSSILHAVQRHHFCFREFPRSQLLEHGDLCQGNTTMCFLCVLLIFPWAPTVVGVTDKIVLGGSLLRSDPGMPMF